MGKTNFGVQMKRFLLIALFLTLTGFGPLSVYLFTVENPALADQQAPARTDKKKEKRIKFYRNPMNPSIHSDVPAKDSMGMDYIPVYESDEETAPSEKSVDGHTTFNLTPEQLKLTGTRIVTTEKRDLIKELRVPGRSLGGDRISFQTYEEDLAYIEPGLRFKAEAPALPGEELTGKVTSIESILDPMTRTARVNATLDGKHKPLRIESSLLGTLQIKLTGVIAVPESAIFHTGSKNFVFVIDGNGSFQPRAVDLGTKAEGYYEIKSGLKLGEKISAGPNFLIDSESRIQSGYDSSNH
jgi:hypothetical protein